MVTESTTTVRRAVAVVVTVSAMLLAWVAAPTPASAHPDLHGKHVGAAGGIGVEISVPEDLAGFFPGVQYTGTAAVDGQSAQLVYAGTGCTPASYAPVATQIRGNIALVDSRQSVTNPADQCPAYAFAQKIQSAEQAGAIGFIEITEEGTEASGGSAVTASIPAIDVNRTDGIVAARDAVVAGETVEASFVDKTEKLEAQGRTECVDGQAGPFECQGVDLLSFTPKEAFDGSGISDIWGWTDPDTGREYAMFGKTNGTAFVDVTDPTAPAYLGEVPNPAAVPQVWHDIKVYKNHAFIVSESNPHGMMVFDLTRLRDLTADPDRDFAPDATYDFVVASHNLEINTETGFAYIVGGNAGIVAPDQCLSGLHMVDIREPKNPTFAGCFLEEGGPGTAARSVGGPVQGSSPAAYVHDTECVVYDGPDEEHADQEICFNSAEDGMDIADVTNKLTPSLLGSTTYEGISYAHQATLTDDHRYLLLNDELDEQSNATNTRTVVIDVTDLDNPEVEYIHEHETESIDHNNYVHEGFVYQSNYTAGLRVLDLAEVDSKLTEVAYFDTFPAHTDPTFNGTWSNYPFFESGTIAVTGIDEGLFLLKVDEGVLNPQPAVDLTCSNCPVEIRAGESGTAQLVASNIGNVDDTYQVTVDGLPDGWSATVDPEAVPVASGETGDVAVTVDVPIQQRAGSHTLTVTATSSVDPDVSAAQEVEVDVVKGRPSDPPPVHLGLVLALVPFGTRRRPA